MKLAELKNFEAARAVFDQWDEESIVQMENYLIEEYRHLQPDKVSPEEYIALKFLDQLIIDWDSEQKNKIEHLYGVRR